MDDKVWALLDEHNVLVLPEVIEHETFILIVEALTRMAGREVRLFCRGDGGSSRAALAIVDVIQEYANIIGILPGEANSSHAIIFAGCTERYVYPRGTVGLHKLAFDFTHVRMDSLYARQLANEYELAEARWCEILAAASNHTPIYWHDVIQNAGSGGIVQFDAAKMIEMGLARPINELK